MPIPVAEWPKVKVCSLSLAGIMGWNPDGPMSFSCVSVCCKVEVSWSGRSPIQENPTTVFLPKSVI